MLKKGPPRKKVNVLLVDDRPENLLTLEGILDCSEYNLVRANSGEEALRFLLYEEFAVILLDVNMPGLSGFEIAALIKRREKTRNTPIIFVTAVGVSEQYIERGYAVGGVDYIVKPFNPQILRKKIAVFVELFNKTDQLRRQSAQLRLAERRERLAMEQASRQRYRNLADAIPQIVWIASADGELEYFNRRWSDYTGLPMERSTGMKGWMDVVHPEEIRFCLDRWKESVKVGLPYEVECRYRRFDHVYRWHLVRAVLEKDEAGKVLAWLGTSTDIDDQKRVEKIQRDLVEELTEKSIAVENANRLKSQFVASVSHELRTPLNAIIGYSSLLGQDVMGRASQKQKLAIAAIYRNGKELLNLVSNILDLSKIESGQMTVHLEEVDLKTLLPMVLEDNRTLLNGKVNVEIQWHIESDLKAIRGDLSKLKQIFLNLLSNAIKFTEKGLISVSAMNLDHGILFSVQDTGPGIRDEDLAHIFDPFRQGENALTSQSGGTGLGLAIVKENLRLIGGRVEVITELRKGSTFRVFLPDNMPPNSSLAVHSSSAAGHSGNGDK